MALATITDSQRFVDTWIALRPLVKALPPKERAEASALLDAIGLLVMGPWNFQPAPSR